MSLGARLAAVALIGAVAALPTSIVAVGCNRAQTGVAGKGQDVWLQANGWRLKARVYQSADPGDRPLLVVVLHGDLLGVRAVPVSTYHYLFAGLTATQNRGLVAVGVLRPGYRDETGERSDGDIGQTTGDNYTPDVIDAIAQAIDQLKAKFNSARTILVGHSGGAAISADLLGRIPGKADAALLVSCPCDLPAWRRHMQALQNGNPIWSAPIHGLSPMDLVDGVPASDRVHLIVGEKDSVAPPELTQRYAERLRRVNSHVSVTIVPGLEHDILLEGPVLGALKSLVDQVRQASPPGRP